MASSKGYRHGSSPAPRRDLYQEVTNGIVRELEKGVAPWVRPWNATDPGLPRNGGSGREYHGLNVVLLWSASRAKGFSSQEWVTFNQARELGGHVRKGERSTLVTFWRFLHSEERDPGTGEIRRKTIPLLRDYHVFDRDQCDGLPAPRLSPLAGLSESDRIARANAFLRATAADVRHGGDRAYYSPSADYVQLPPFATFRDAASYYGTGLHELAHWTGHASRCARDFSGRFGSAAYAAEELVAELGSAFLCAKLGIDGKLQHPEYIASWLSVLRGDKRAIFTAASKAREGVDFLNRVTGSESQPETEETVEAVGEAA